ncbi:MAG: hypothetical protein KC636_34070, partial [Myxococcales bacterium]|nr:hypothetical protein [Myxococcales bacterium]
HGGNLKSCVDALKALFDIMVSGYAEAECSNGMCEAEAGGSIACSCTASEPFDSRDAALALVLALGIAGVRRRRA